MPGEFSPRRSCRAIAVPESPADAGRIGYGDPGGDR
jgi:hypothetical protein